MAFLDTTRNINLSSPVNQLGYGVAGLNIAKALHDLKHSVALFVIGNLEAPEQYHEPLKQMIANSRMPDWTAPSIRLWHQPKQGSLELQRRADYFKLIQIIPFIDIASVKQKSFIEI